MNNKYLNLSSHGEPQPLKNIILVLICIKYFSILFFCNFFLYEILKKMNKNEICNVERFPVAVLLEDEGIPATGDLSTFPGLSSNPKIVADLITLHRDKERQQQMSKTKVIPESVVLAADGKTINFSLTNEIDVQKPELLMEQMGVDRLIRLTYCKASLNSNDGNVMAIFASALEQDMNGADGPALRQTIDSFVVTDQTPK